jgi:hypothetical protein
VSFVLIGSIFLAEIAIILRTYLTNRDLLAFFSEEWRYLIKVLGYVALAVAAGASVGWVAFALRERWFGTTKNQYKDGSQ